MKTESSVRTNRIVTLGILSALGAVLMLVEIPYPLVPFLTFDLSDVVVLVIFMLYGWKEASLVALLKVVVHLIIKGPVGPVAIGQISAFIASMGYVGGMFVAIKVYHLNRYLAALIVAMVVTVLMVVANYLFITPIYMGGLTFLDVQDWVTLSTFGLEGSPSYLQTIIILYTPFNIIKGLLITLSFFAIYELLNRQRIVSFK
ncbi:MAG: ECF transporter S component [Candidatus Izemoplasma sp.]|nr:ECF transporter S component [Candidatus Izemoplasma sp.]